MAAPSPGRPPAPRTITAYLSTGASSVRFLRAAGMPTAASGIRGEHLETLIEAQLARFRRSTAATRYEISADAIAYIGVVAYWSDEEKCWCKDVVRPPLHVSVCC